MLKQFNQVKLSSTGSNEIFRLFDKFHLRKTLTKCKIVKEKGHEVTEMLFVMLLIILENCNSVFSGIVKNNAKNLKTPINDMLNNTEYNWRNYLYKIAKCFSQLCPNSNINDWSLSIDDTSKVKTGHKTQNSSWFHDHCNNTHFKGFQNITAALSNGRTAIPIDFELKIGKKRTKHSRTEKYLKGTHAHQRVCFAKKKKTSIVMQMIKRALQRKFKFKYILWDSWFNNSEVYSFLYSVIIPKGIVLISMLKRGNSKYKYGQKYLTVNELYDFAGKWNKDNRSGIKFKNIEVELLDASSHRFIKNRSTIGKIKICFFKYPKVRNWKCILSTDLDLEEMDVLKVYLRRWSIECIFKEIKQYFGYSQSKSSNYIAMISDLTIRYSFYIMFCYLKEVQNNKPLGQLLTEFYQELFELWLFEFIELMCMRYVHEFIDYALKSGYSKLEDLKKNLEKTLHDFFEQKYIPDKITDSDKHEFRKTA